MRNRSFISTAAALTLFLYIPAAGAAADRDSGTATTIGKFMKRKELLVVKEVYVLGKIPGLYSSSGEINAIVAYEPGKKESRLKGLIFTVKEGRSEERTYTSYLDFEEIGDLSSAITSMENLSGERKKTDSTYTEIIYTTEDSLSFGVYLGDGEEEVFITAGEEDKVTIYLEPKGLKDVKKIVDYGHTLLKMK